MTVLDPVPTAEIKNKQKFIWQALRKETTRGTYT